VGVVLARRQASPAKRKTHSTGRYVRRQLSEGGSSNGRKSDDGVAELHFEMIAGVCGRDKRWKFCDRRRPELLSERGVRLETGEQGKMRKHGDQAFKIWQHADTLHSQERGATGAADVQSCRSSSLASQPAAAFPYRAGRTAISCAKFPALLPYTLSALSCYLGYGVTICVLHSPSHRIERGKWSAWLPGAKSCRRTVPIRSYRRGGDCWLQHDYWRVGHGWQRPTRLAEGMSEVGRCRGADPIVLGVLTGPVIREVEKGMDCRDGRSRCD